ncbi:MAG: OmpP1/FadL family transporter [Litorivicinus sp.]
MRKSILAVAVAAATVVSGANAAGFYLKEQSVVGQGRAFAGSAAGTDGASAAYFNPAGIVGLERQVEVGVHYIKPMAEVTDQGTTAAAAGTTTIPTSPIDSTNFNALGLGTAVTMDQQNPYSGKAIPNLHFIQPLDDHTAASIYVGAPFGFGNKYNEDYFGQYDSIKNELSVIEISGSLAKRVSDTLKVAFSLNYQSLDVEQSAMAAPGFTSTLKGTASEVGYVLSFQKTLGQSILGFSHRSETTHDVTGTQTFFNKTTGAQSAVGTTGPVVNATATFGLPAITALGIAHEVSDQTRVYGDVTYYGWSNYERGNVTASDSTGGLPTGTIFNPAVNNYTDTVSLAIGIEHDYGNGLTVRSGAHYDPTPTNDTDRATSTPDGDRLWLAGGFTKEVTEALMFDAALTYILVDDGAVDRSTTKALARNSSGVPTQTLTINTKAKSEGNVGILSLGLRYKF